MNQKPGSHLGFCSMPWLKRKSLFHLQSKTNEVYHTAFRVQKLQQRSSWCCCSKAPCPDLPVLSLCYPPPHLHTCRVLGAPPSCPYCPLPCLLTLRQTFPPPLRTGLLPLFIQVPFFWAGDVHTGLSLSRHYCCLIIKGHWSPCVFSKVV